MLSKLVFVFLVGLTVLWSQPALPTTSFFGRTVRVGEEALAKAPGR